LHEREVIDRFHELYYESRERTWGNTRWLGRPVFKTPLDLWIYQEILHERRPDLIVETGTRHGGSALFFASICDLLDHGSVITVDIVAKRAVPPPEHRRIDYVTGSSVAPEVVETISAAAAGKRVMVILDSDHTKGHVLAEIRTYAPLVTPGDYLVVEDTNVNGNPVNPGFGDGPMEAVAEFLAENDAFAVDEAREKFLFTFNPRGYLRRSDASSNR
jgi:cephalosporin hydroxylase